MLTVYEPNNDTDRPAPALRRKRVGLQVEPGAPRKCVQVAVESIWDVLEESRFSGVSIPKHGKANEASCVAHPSTLMLLM